MSKSEKVAKSEDVPPGKRGPPPLRTHRPPVSGHPEPHPPADASEPEAKAPAVPIANDLLQKAQQAAPATGGGRMGPGNVAPQTTPAPESNPLGMTQPAEEPSPERNVPKGRPGKKAKSR